MKFDKKIKYAIRQMLTNYVEEAFPTYKTLCEAYLDFLDQSDTHALFNKIINITDNTDYNKMYTELLDEFMTQFYSEFVFNPDDFNVSDNDKRFFINYGKMLSNSKGTSRALIFLIRYLNNLALKDGTTIPKIGISYEENESWWDKTDPNYSPFTYKMTVGFPEEFIKDLIRLYHPAGFKRAISLEPAEYVDNLSEYTITSLNDSCEIFRTDLIVYNGRYTYGGNDLNGDPLVYGSSDKYLVQEAYVTELFNGFV